MIERAYREGEKTGISVWGVDQAGPFQTMPYPGSSWEMQGKPARHPHQHLRNGTAKLMSLLPSGYGEGSGQRSEELQQRGAPPLAQGALESHPQNFAAATTTAQPRGEPSGVEKLAGGAYGEGDAPRGATAVEDVGGFGQP